MRLFSMSLSSKKICLFCAALIFFVGISNGKAGAGPLEDLLARVEKKAATVQTFTCEFRQTRTLAMFSRPVIFKGKLTMMRPDKLRWEFLAPMPSTLILNGSKGMKCSANSPVRKFDLNTDPVMGLVIRQLWSWMDGQYLNMRDLYDMKLVSGETIVLFPKQTIVAQAIKQIRVSFDPGTLQPDRINIMEAGGDKTVINFHDYSFGITPEASMFTECKSNH